MLLGAQGSSDVVITNPTHGTDGDDWDSPEYDRFWSPTELSFKNKADLLNKVGKKVTTS